MGSITTRRFLGLERRKPYKITVDIEEEFYNAIKTNQLRITAVVNHGIEKYLREEGFIQ
jgi:hypothetical protein